MYIHKITLNTGSRQRLTRDAVDDTTLAVVRPWLVAAVASQQRTPLPVAALSHFSAVALRHESGGLVVTIYGPAGPHIPGQASTASQTPLATMGIAQRSRHGTDLWGMLMATFGRWAHIGIKNPRAPWCAAVALPGLLAYPDSAQWLDDLESCIAWAWITHTPDLLPIR